MVLLRDHPNLFWMENDKGSIVDKILVRPAKYTVKTVSYTHLDVYKRQ